MPKTKTQKDQLCLILSIQTPAQSGAYNDRGYYHVMARVGVYAGPSMDYHNDVAVISPEAANGMRTRDLSYSFQGDREMARVFNHDLATFERGFSAGFNERDAELMAKTLRTVNAKIRKLADTFGSTYENPPEAIVRFAQAVGADRAYIANDGPSKTWDAFYGLPEIRIAAQRVVSSAISRWGKRQDQDVATPEGWASVSS